MKITLASDLHLEFNAHPSLDADADVLILSGDICVADHLTKSEASPYFKFKTAYMNFFTECKEKFKHILYVPGNHEHYHGRFNDTVDILKRELDGLVTVLNNETVEIDGVKFIGTTLWTDANKQNPITVAHMHNYMNDYRVIQIFRKGVYRKLIPNDTLCEHFAAVQFIDQETKDHDNCVVLTHHGPTPMSIGPDFVDDYHGNGGYVSNLFDFIYDRPQIKLWTHGHVHHHLEYKVNDTTVACNPGGYPREDTGFDRSFLFEL